ncbi:glycosyltransferase [Periweissella cryptocerci]|uniref:Glycosyltransferase n=1 Tax=Periweissella cryptocerci TaxID=2506420 RepID=A0A4P6YTT6_9LACO|nr:glycosyltransferase family 2 protein [Periweissella cryptocerci]QBO36112.1 glycosyltransferase [Periweissella cryptocerci]
MTMLPDFINQLSHALNFNTLIYVVLFAFVFYPVVGGSFWILGGSFYVFWARKKRPVWNDDFEEPFISILIAAHNEEATIEGTLHYLLDTLEYSNYEILVINDGSTDSTAEVLVQLANKHERLRIVTVEKNKGKAHALTVGAMHAKGEFLLSNDADTFITGDTLKRMAAWMVVDSELAKADEIGAVTGNPTPVNRSTIVAKSQFIEFNSIVGLIKQAQTVIGRMFAVSGANTLYRKSALNDVGYFDQGKATEDIAIAWNMQLKGWRVHYDPNVRSYIEVPETGKELVRQRKRWAQGGIEVFLTYALTVLRHPFKTFPFIFIFFDQMVSILWAYFFWISMTISVFYVGYLVITGNWERVLHFFVMSGIFVMFEFIVGYLQLTIALLINHGIDSLKYMLFASWYVVIMWMVNPYTILIATPDAVRAVITGGSGTWVSPERMNKDKVNAEATEEEQTV